MITEQGALLGERYRLDELIAIGGMGQVWEATDVVLGRSVAVKIMKEELRGASTFLERFRAEARHAGSLGHPGIASVYDYGEGPDAAYLVMELVRGRPLSDLMASGEGMSDAFKVSILRQSADALQAAHDAGVVHRDVKPGNLLVREDGTVKVTDFGIARALTSVPLTDTGQLLGTPTYLSPEQASGGNITAASDVYSLGVVAYELFAGRPPFIRDTPVALAVAHVHDSPPPLPDFVPRGVAAVINSALAKDPLQRPRSAGEFSSRLQSAMPARGAAQPAATVLMAVPTAHATRTMAVPAEVAVGPVPRSVPPRRAVSPSPRRRHIPALLFLALLTAMVVGIWALTKGGAEAERLPTDSTLVVGSSTSPTSNAASTVAPTTLASALPTTVLPATAPMTVAPTAPPTVPATPAPAPPTSLAATPPGPPAASGNTVSGKEAVAFVADYYEALADRDYESTWPLLSDEFRRERELTFERYVAYWERYDIELSNLRHVGDSPAGEALVRFDARYTSGSTAVDETDELTLRREPDGTLIITGQRRV